MGRKLYRDERGIAMIAVVMTLLVVSLLSTAALSMATSNTKNSIVEREFQSAYYIAEAGMTIYMNKIKTDMNSAWNSTTNADDFFTQLENNNLSEITYTTEFKSQYGYQPDSKVKLIKVSGASPAIDRTYKLISRGTTENVTRTVTKHITIQWFPKIDLGNLLSVFALGDMTLKKGSIDGPIGTNGTISVPLQVPGIDANPKIDDYYIDDTKIPAHGSYDKYRITGIIGADSSDSSHTWWINSRSGDKHELLEEKEYPLPVFPTFPDVSLATTKSNEIYSNNNASNICLLTDSLTYIPKISVTANGSMTIKYNGDCSLLVDDFNIPNGKVYLDGTGRLTLYVRDKISFANTEINPPSGGMTDLEAANRLTIYLKGRVNSAAPVKTFTVDDNTKLYGSFYAEDANVKIENSGKHIGNIVTGGTDVVIKGGSSTTNQLIYAPLAKVEMNGYGIIYGPIIADEFILDGSGTVKPGPGNLLPNPFFPEEGAALISIESATREQ